MKLTDTELWRRVLSDDSTAWQTLIDRYQALVYTVATRSGLSMADAADCFQQTWVLLYQHRKKVKDPSRLSAWLVTTAKREALRMIRKGKRQSNIDDIAEPVSESPLPDEELAALETQGRLRSALEQLDDRCRKLIDMLFFAPKDWSYEQVAKSVGIAVNSLGPIRGRCLGRMRKILEANGWLRVRNDEG